AAPAPMNLAAVSISRLTELVWKPRSATWDMGLCGTSAVLASPDLASGLEITEAERGLYRALDPARTIAGVETNFAQAYIFVGFVDC
ncbi:hypothetical protein DKP78_17570, partial [Enterococcus faecium]